LLIINGKKHDINRIVYSKKLHLRIGIDLTQLWGWNVISHSFSESAISAKSYSFFFFLYLPAIFLIISQIYTTILFIQNKESKINLYLPVHILRVLSPKGKSNIISRTRPANRNNKKKNRTSIFHKILFYFSTWQKNCRNIYILYFQIFNNRALPQTPLTFFSWNKCLNFCHVLNFFTKNTC